MQTTIIIKDNVINKAAELTGIKEKTALVHAGLEALIEKKPVSVLRNFTPRHRNSKLGGRHACQNTKHV